MYHTLRLSLSGKKIAASKQSFMASCRFGNSRRVGQPRFGCIISVKRTMDPVQLKISASDGLHDLFDNEIFALLAVGQTK